MSTANTGVLNNVPPIDSIVIVSFGGPEGPDEVLPFLQNVTSGRNVPEERLAAVAEQYSLFNGVSPINEQNRALIAALERSLTEAEIDLPIYGGNRNWHPFLHDTIATMVGAQHRHALAIVTSAFGSFSGCRQYRNDLGTAARSTGDQIILTKARLYWNHPGFLRAFADRIATAMSLVDAHQQRSVRLVFTAHSIPQAWVATSPYVSQLKAAADYLASSTAPHLQWDLVYQSRSGSPRDPWLGPDIVEHLERVATAGTETVVVVPLGFVSDHMEVRFDLDVQARQAAESLGLVMIRAATPGTHPAFVDTLHDLVEEHIGPKKPIATIGEAWPNSCPAGCCAVPQR